MKKNIKSHPKHLASTVHIIDSTDTTNPTTWIDVHADQWNTMPTTLASPATSPPTPSIQTYRGRIGKFNVEFSKEITGNAVDQLPMFNFIMTIIFSFLALLIIMLVGCHYSPAISTLIHALIDKLPN